DDLHVIKTNKAEQGMIALPINDCGCVLLGHFVEPCGIRDIKHEDISCRPRIGRHTVEHNDVELSSWTGRCRRHTQFGVLCCANGFFEESIAWRHEQHFRWQWQQADDGSLVVCG